MKTITDFPFLSIADYRSKEPRTFKESDLKKAESLGLDTVQAVLDDQRVGACRSMKEKLRSYPDGIVNIYNYFFCTPLLPSECFTSSSIADDLKSFLGDLDALLVRFKAMPFDFDTTAKTKVMETLLSAVKYRYLMNLDDAAIAMNLKITSESSRLYHSLFINKFREAMRSERTTSKNQFILEFGLNDVFREKVQMLCDSFTSGCTLASLHEALGCKDEGIVRFALDLLDASVFTGSGSSFEGSYVVSGFNLTRFDQDGMALFSIMSTCHEPKADFMKALSKSVKDREKLATIATMVQTSGQFNVTQMYGLESYQLKWQYLKNDDARYERILFENKGCSMSKDDLLAEYNRRAALYHMNKRDDFRLSQSERVVAQNGMWHWVEAGEDVKIFQDPRPFIESFVAASGGTVMLEDVIGFLEGKGVSLSENSVRAYLTKFCKASRGTNRFTILKQTAVPQRGDIAPEIIAFIRRQSNQVCVSDIAKALETSPGRIDRIIDLHPELFVKDSIPTRKKVYVTMKPGYNAKPVEVKQLGRTKEAQHLTFIRMTAVDILSKAEGNRLPMKEVFDKVRTGIDGLGIEPNIIYKVFNHKIFVKASIPGKREKTLCLNMPLYESLYKKDARYAEETSVAPEPKEFDWNEDYEELKEAVKSFVKDNPHARTFDVSKAFDVMNDIMKGSRVNLNRDSYFWLIQELLFKYLTQKTTTIEREFLRDNLAYKYEPFLEHYYEQVTGRTLGVEGLVTSLRLLQDEGLLPARYSDWSSSYTTNLVDKRNRVHRAKRDMDSIIKKDILQFLVLYLYTASKKMEEF